MNVQTLALVTTIRVSALQSKLIFLQTCYSNIAHELADARANVMDFEMSYADEEHGFDLSRVSNEEARQYFKLKEEVNDLREGLQKALNDSEEVFRDIQALSDNAVSQIQETLV